MILYCNSAQLETEKLEIVIHAHANLKSLPQNIEKKKRNFPSFVGIIPCPLFIQHFPFRYCYSFNLKTRASLRILVNLITRR